MPKFSASRIVTPPALEPVTVDEMGAHLRLSSAAQTADAALLEVLISGAREHVELQTSRALINQSWVVTFDASVIMQQGIEDQWWDGVRDGAISQNCIRDYELPKAPLVSVTSFKYFSEDDTETVYGAANYLVDTFSTPGRASIKPGVAAPTPTRRANAVIIEYVAGYGLTAEDVPAPLRQVIKLVAAHWYENREVTASDSNVIAGPVPMSVNHILRHYKVAKL